MVPNVSVIIPTRDRIDLVARALASALGQRDVALEVVLVDDGSAAEAAEALARLAAPGVRVVRNERSRAPAGARNAGIDAARGEWVAFLDDDDYWAPDKLRCQLAALERAGAAWAWSGAAYVTGAGEFIWAERAPTPAEARRQIPSGTVIPAGASNVIARRDLLLDLGGFDERVFHLPDWDMWLRLMLADPGASHPEAHVAYVQHDGMLSFRRSEVLRGDVELIEAKVRRAGLRRDHAVTDYAMLEWYVDAHIVSRNWSQAARKYAVRAIRHGGLGDVALAAGALGREPGLRTVRAALAGLRAVRARLREHEPVMPSPVQVPRPAWLDDAPAGTHV
jgi:glycosyltransferase involved in cell wall biosynthesis